MDFEEKDLMDSFNEMNARTWAYRLFEDINQKELIPIIADFLITEYKKETSDSDISEKAKRRRKIWLRRMFSGSIFEKQIKENLIKYNYKHIENLEFHNRLNFIIDLLVKILHDEKLQDFIDESYFETTKGMRYLEGYKALSDKPILEDYIYSKFNVKPSNLLREALSFLYYSQYQFELKYKVEKEKDESRKRDLRAERDYYRRNMDSPYYCDVCGSSPCMCSDPQHNWG